jgi:hypothetical protein
MIYKLVTKFVASVFVEKLEIAELEKKLFLLIDTQWFLVSWSQIPPNIYQASDFYIILYPKSVGTYI